MFLFFFFKQKTAYELRISDWSSDVCSSDLGIDCFSRFVELRAAPSAAAEEAARLLLDIFGRYGPPRFLRTDNGSQFTAKVISDFLALVGAERQLTRSEERRVGKECFSTCRYRWSQYH